MFWYTPWFYLCWSITYLTKPECCLPLLPVLPFTALPPTAALPPPIPRPSTHGQLYLPFYLEFFEMTASSIYLFGWDQPILNIIWSFGQYLFPLKLGTGLIILLIINSLHFLFWINHRAIVTQEFYEWVIFLHLKFANPILS